MVYKMVRYNCFIFDRFCMAFSNQKQHCIDNNQILKLFISITNLFSVNKKLSINISMPNLDENILIC
jgi:hypothetical protein